MKKYKFYTKAANMLLQVLYGLKHERLQKMLQRLEEFKYKTSDINRSSIILQKATDRRWYSSAEKIRSRISRDANDFLHHLELLKTAINAEDIKLPKLGDIVAELAQIEDEFGEIKIDLKAKTISIITESIALKGIVFGPFEIRLYLNQIKKLGFESPYRIVALDPNPAGSDCDVTHPHVSQ